MAQGPIWQAALDGRLPIWQVPASMNALQKYLVDTEITVADFAESIGRAPSTLWRQVRGERSPSLAVAIDVERGTGGKITARQFLAICVVARRKAMNPKPTRKAAPAKSARAAA